MANIGARANVRGSFNPRAINSLAVWLDADDPSTITTSSGQVTQWLDKSSNASQFTRPSDFNGLKTGPALATYNGRTALQFNGTNTVLRWAGIPGTGKRTMFFVIVPTTLPAAQSIFFDYYPFASGTYSWMPSFNMGCSTAGAITYFKRSTNSGASYSGIINSSAVNSSTLVRASFDDVTYMASYTYNLKVAVNRATATTTGSSLSDGSRNGICVGARDGVISSGYYDRYFTGYVCEILIFNDTLPATLATEIEDYLARKWAVPLPTTASRISSPLDISNCSFWVDASDISTLKQDSAGTTAVTATGQTVAYWADKSGTNQHVINAGASTVCPTYVTGRQNNRPVVYFDGGDSLLSAADRTTAGPVTVIAACRDRGTVSTVGGVVTVGGSTGGEGGPGIYSNAAQYIADGPGGNTTTSANTVAANHVGVFATVAAVYTQSSTVNSYVYRDGALEEYFTGTGVSPVTGTRVQIGGRTGGGVPSRVFLGDIAEAIIYDRALTLTELNQVARYLNEKWSTGVTRPTSGHPEAQDWINRVYYNGGSVSQYTADKVTEFCYRIDANNLRSKFYRLNLFCGNNLPACLVPLYRGPRPLERIFGGAVDRTCNYAQSTTTLVGNGFYNSPADYVEMGSVTNGGLNGSNAGNTRTIFTGLYYKELPSLLNAHFSSFFRINTTPATATYPLGGLIGGAETTVNFQQVRISVNVPTTSGFSFATAISGTNLASADNVALGPHFVIASRTSATSLTAYLDGTIAGTNTTTTADYVSPFILCVCGASNGGGAGGAFPHTICAYSAGLGLSQAEAQAFNTAMQAFQAALGRNT